MLEGLNSVFDHRSSIFIPELGKTFNVDSNGTRFFACQNPLQQGGGRKGLPKSFLNRFNQVDALANPVREQADSTLKLIVLFISYDQIFQKF